jgi:hypothetical protein
MAVRNELPETLCSDFLVPLRRFKTGKTSAEKKEVAFLHTGLLC